MPVLAPVMGGQARVLAGSGRVPSLSAAHGAGAAHLLHHVRAPLHHLRFPFASIVALALVSGAAYGLGAVLQHQAAVREPAELSMTAGLLLHLVRRPMWVVGNLLDIAGFLLQFVALRKGSLALVEPLLVSSLVFALPASALLTRRRIKPAELGASLLVAGGLTLFLEAGRPGAGDPHASLFGWVMLAAVVAGAVLACTQGARGGSRRRASVLLAAGAGISFGYVASVAELAGHQLARGLLHTLGSWSPYAMTAAAVAGLLLTQSAFQAGELRLSLPMLTIAQPVAAIVIGQTLFAEHLRVGPLPTLGMAVGMALMCVGVFALARPVAAEGA